jgi:flagellar protein FlaJ
MVKYLCRILIPAGGIVLLGMLVMKVDLGYMFLAASAFLFPIGLVATTDDKKVTLRDADVSAFLRSLGGTMAAIGATAAEAMGRLDFRSLGILTEDVKLLHTRLEAGVSPNLCWDRFVSETGSELVNRTVRIFWDGISLGGDAQRIGNEASAFALKISLLRSQRTQISLGFTWLTIAMHAVLVTLSVFVYEVFLSFSTLVQSIIPQGSAASLQSLGLASSGFFSSGGTEIKLLHFMIILITIILTIANAFAIYAVSGGHTAKLTFYLAITSAISGLIMLGVPPVVSMMFLNFK